MGKKGGLTSSPEGRATTDLTLLIVVLVAAAAAAMKWRVFDGLLDWSRTSTGFNLSGVIALLVLAPIATALFARRRYGEAMSIRRELVRLSLHDPLTGLPNRMLLADWLAADIQASQRSNSQAAVLFVDLDRFKQVNDTHGHEVGDRLMRAVADRLRTMLRPEDRVVRFGGDEFVVLCPSVNSADGAKKIAHRVIEIIEQPFTIGDETLRISASVGVALTEHRGVKPEDVLRDADVAMYQAKAQGSGHVTIFDRSMTGTLTPATAEEQIRDALESGEFHLHYQPVVEMATGRIVGAEALLRWISPERGTMSPGDFIPIMEETGLIVPVGTWVLEEACRESARLTELLEGAPPVTITVNVSARQLAQVDFGDRVASALHNAGVGPGRIHLEITEGALMHDVASAWAMLRQAKSLGVKLALDDFGTGYSSLSYVRRFSLDMLKIDKSFIDGIDSSPEDRAIVEHVVGMADALGMVTVAEGVERPEQLTWLKKLGCKLAQGYVLSRPIPGEDLEAILARRELDPFGVLADRNAGNTATIDLATGTKTTTRTTTQPAIGAPKAATSTPPVERTPAAPARRDNHHETNPLDMAALSSGLDSSVIDALTVDSEPPTLVDEAGRDLAEELADLTAADGATRPPDGGTGNGNGNGRTGGPTLPRFREYRPVAEESA